MKRERKQPKTPRRSSLYVVGAQDYDVPGSTITDVMQWVGTDISKAQSAWDAEARQDKPRPSLLARLEARGAVQR